MVQITKRKSIVYGLLVLLAAIVVRWGCGVYERVHEYHLGLARCAELEKVGKALQQYADASDGNYYPPRSSTPGVFLPDFDAWERGAPDKAAFEEAHRILTDSSERQLCYIGYAFNLDTLAQRILDSCEANPSAFRGGAPATPEGKYHVNPASPEIYAPHPLKTGAQRFFHWQIVFNGVPPRADQLSETIPVLWEMPRGIQDRVTIHYLDGRARRSQYPGEVVMSRLFVNRLRGLMGISQDPEFHGDSPIIPVVRRIMDASRGEERRFLSVSDFDSAPSVSAAGRQGYRIMLDMAAGLVLFPESGGRPGVSASTLFAPPRRDKYNCPDVAASIGTGAGYHWYGNADYATFLLLQSAFNLRGGETLYASAVANCRRNDPAWFWLDGRGVSENKTPICLWQYVRSFLVCRESEGRPVSDEILDAGAILDGFYYEGYGFFARPAADLIEEAKQRLVSASKSDPEAATTLALLYVLRYRIRDARGEPTDEGMEFIRRFPQEAVISSIKKAMGGFTGRDAEPCQKLLEKLQRRP